MRSGYIIQILFFVFLFGFISCKKDTDEYGPDVDYITPFENQTFQVYDYINVKASVKDETKITSVSLTLVDVNYIPVHNALNISVSSPEMQINVDYYIDNIHLESGRYYLMITASDGKNDSRTFLSIMINAVPKVLKKVFVTTTSSSVQTQLWYIDSTFSGMNSFRTLSGDLLASSASSYHQQVFVCGNYTGNFTGISVANNSVKFNFVPSLGSTPFFTAYYADEQRTYVAQYNEIVRGYNNSGNLMYSANANPGYYIRKMIMNNKCLLAEEKAKTPVGNLLVSYFETGATDRQVSLSQDVVSFCEKDDHNVFLFGNIGSQGVIQLFDRLNNNLWNPYPYTLPAGTIKSAIRIDAETYLIAHSNGTIYKYQYTSSSLTTYLTGFTARQLVYDYLNNDIYIVEPFLVTVVDYPSKVTVHSVPSAESIIDISLLYNR